MLKTPMQQMALNVTGNDSKRLDLPKVYALTQ